jgi:hypothetical protein
MPDLASISVILTSLKTATEIAKALREADVSLEKAEMKLKLADLIGALAEARISIAEVNQELSDKANRINELERLLSARQTLTYDAPFYWSSQGAKREGPYCQQCYDSKGKTIRVQEIGDGYFDCMACKSRYDARPERERQTRAVTDFNVFDS